MQLRKIPRTENPMVEDVDQTGNDTKIYLGAKSGNGREPGNRQTRNGLDLIALTKKEEGDWTRDDSQMI